MHGGRGAGSTSDSRDRRTGNCLATYWHGPGMRMIDRQLFSTAERRQYITRAGGPSVPYAETASPIRGRLRYGCSGGNQVACPPRCQRALGLTGPMLFGRRCASPCSFSNRRCREDRRPTVLDHHLPGGFTTDRSLERATGRSMGRAAPPGFSESVIGSLRQVPAVIEEKERNGCRVRATLTRISAGCVMR